MMPVHPLITTHPAGDLPQAITDQIGAWFRREFDWEMDKTAPADWRVLVMAGDQLVAHVGIILRTATVNQEPLQLGGIAAVITQPQWRGRGFASAAMRQAQDFLQQNTGAAYGLLICEDYRLSFYQQLGWRQVPGPMVFTAWDGKRTVCGHNIMIYPLRGKPWPPGEIDLCGLPW